MKLNLSLSLSQRIRKFALLIGGNFALAALYFSTARFGLSLDAVSGFATLVWLPSGIALAALQLFGYRLWPGIFTGAFLANLLNGAPPFVAIGIGIGNTLEPAVGTYLLKRNGFNIELNRVRDVLLLVCLAMPLSSLISATIGVFSLFLGKIIIVSAFFNTWSAWWVGDMISILIITPFLLVWSKLPHETVTVGRWAEIGLLAVSVLATGMAVFLGLFHTNHGGFPRTYLVFPPLVWASLRFGQRGTLTALLSLSIFAIIGTIQSLSPFSSGNPDVGLISLQGFMGTTAITSMILAANVEERKALERRKDEFISMASHELKTPLTSLLVYMELLHKKFAEPGNQEAVRYLAKMKIQIEKLSRLIADLLDISKIQAGKITFAEEVVDFDELVREVVENLQLTGSQHHISIEGKAQREMVGDRERLGQVLINVITNAIKYSPQAEEIIVRLSHEPAILTVSVQDFGIGIPVIHQKRIFERFYRVYSDKDRTYPGLGIGLYIAYQIIDHHHGKIWVESVEGQGATFSFSLPLRG
jgi:signal transduction histidine kinase